VVNIYKKIYYFPLCSSLVNGAYSLCRAVGLLYAGNQ